VYLGQFIDKIDTWDIYNKYMRILSKNFKEMSADFWILKKENSKYCPSEESFKEIGYSGDTFDFYLFSKNINFADNFVKTGQFKKRGTRRKKDYLSRVGLTIKLWYKIKKDFDDTPYRDYLKGLVKPFKVCARKYNIIF